MSKFSVGDRVAFYNIGSRGEGVIGEVAPQRELESIYVELRNGTGLWLHPKQCRKLKKKDPKKKVWVDVVSVPGYKDNYILVNMSASSVDGWTEFVEVRKKK